MPPSRRMMLVMLDVNVASCRQPGAVARSLYRRASAGLSRAPRPKYLPICLYAAYTESPIVGLLTSAEEGSGSPSRLELRECGLDWRPPPPLPPPPDLADLVEALECVER